MGIETATPETKSGIPHDAVVTHAEMMRAFEAIKETSDQRRTKSVPPPTSSTRSSSASMRPSTRRSGGSTGSR